MDRNAGVGYAMEKMDGVIRIRPLMDRNHLHVIIFGTDYLIRIRPLMDRNKIRMTEVPKIPKVLESDH